MKMTVTCMIILLSCSQWKDILVWFSCTPILAEHLRIHKEFETNKQLQTIQVKAFVKEDKKTFVKLGMEIIKHSEKKGQFQIGKSGFEYNNFKSYQPWSWEFFFLESIEI